LTFKKKTIYLQREFTIIVICNALNMIKLFLKNKKNYLNDELQFIRLRFACASPALRLRFAKNFFLAVFTLLSVGSLTAQVLPNNRVRGLVLRHNSSTAPIRNVNITISPTNGVTPVSFLTGLDGGYSTTASGTFIFYTPNLTKTALWQDGLTAYDLVLINKHVLGTQLLTDGFQKIAADVNRSGTITTADKLFLQQLLIEITSSLPVWDRPWQFVPRRVFSNPTFASEFNNNPNALITAGLSYNTSILSSNYLSNSFSIQNPSDPNFFSDNPNTGFAGVKIGDVSGDAPIVNLTNNGASDRNALVAVDYTKHGLVRKGEEFDILLNVENFNSIAGYQMGFKLDNTILHLDKRTDQDGLMSNFKKDALLMSWVEPNGLDLTLDNNVQLLKIRAKALEDISDISEVFKLENTVLSSAFYNGNGSTVPVRLSFAIYKQAGNNIIFPNPTAGESVLEIEATQNSNIQISIYDVEGRLVQNYSNLVQKGINRIKIDLNNIGNGTYFYAAKYADGVVNGKIIKE
jgi:hypothetical protein